MKTDNSKEPSLPTAGSDDAVIKAEHLTKWFPVKSGLFSTIFSQQRYVKAVEDVSLYVKKAEIFGLAGESGSGKTTTGRLLIRLIQPTGGRIYFQGSEITDLSERGLRPLRKSMQIIFQDPYESLDPRMSIKEIVGEPIRVQKLYQTEEEFEERIKKVLAEVELVPPEEFMYRFPHELSGGQRQRVAVARAFVVNPRFIVADEPVSMLDVSIRAEILNLMIDLVRKYGTSFLYITHDLALAKHMCDRLAIMYLGKVMEMGPTGTVIDEPLHPYTQALITAVPVPDPEVKRAGAVISGEIPSPLNPPSGCRFHTRCPYAHMRCVVEEPPLIEVEEDHWVACHLVGTP